MEKALNEQIVLEGYASFLYLSMASWCDKAGMNGCKNFMRRQSEEERMHMLKIFDYISDVDGHALSPEIKQAPREFDSVQKMFEQVYNHEQKVTQSIHKLIDLANKEDDFTTHHFLQWYVAEQREEEALMRTILDRIKIIGDGPQSLYFIDKEVEAINKETAASEGEAA
jgi:ferritin